MRVRLGVERWLGVMTVALWSAACSHSDNSATAPSGADTVSLVVGQVASVADPAQMPNVLVSGGNTGSQYLVVVVNADTAQDVTQSVNVSAEGAGVRVTSPQTVAQFRAVSPNPARLAFNAGQIAFESRLHAFTASHSAFPRGGFRAAGVRAPASFRVSVRCTASSEPEDVCPTPVPPVDSTVTMGSLVPLHVPTGPDNLCTQYVSTEATVRAVSHHAIIVEDTMDHIANATLPFDSIATEFDTYIYPTDTNHFGSPTDIDHNGRVILMYTGRVNQLSSGGEGGFVGGFFFNGDLFPDTSVSNVSENLSQCAESNYAEIFYLLAPDPNNAFGGGAHTEADVRQLTRGTVAHEFQHMINAGNRLYNCPTCQSFEVTWLDEALAHSAEDWVGRAEDGFADNDQLTYDSITAHGANDLDAFFYENALRYGIWLQNPSQYGATSTLADTSLAVRGAAWSLVEHSAGQYSGNDIAAFTRALAAGPDTGFQNLEHRSGVPFDSVLAGWAVAAYTSGDGVSGLASEYGFVGYDMRDVQNGVNSGTYPLAVTATSQGDANVGGSVEAGGAAYYLLSTTASSFTLHVRGAGGNSAPATDTRIYIVRIR